MRGVIAKGRLRRRYLVVVAADARAGAAAHERDPRPREPDGAHRHRGPPGGAGAARAVASPRSGCSCCGRPSPRCAPDARQTVVAHELTHAAVAPATSGRTPSWLTEGLALYVSGRPAGGGGRPSWSAERRRARCGARSRSTGAVGARTRSAGSSGDAPVRRLRLRVGGRVLHRRPLRPAQAAAPLRRVQPRGARRRGAGAGRRGGAGVLGMPLGRLERDLRRWIVTRAVVDPVRAVAGASSGGAPSGRPGTARRAARSAIAVRVRRFRGCP